MIEHLKEMLKTVRDNLFKNIKCAKGNENNRNLYKLEHDRRKAI